MPEESKGQKETVGRVMHEYKHGELETSTGKPVKNRKQAVAIAMHEAGCHEPGKPEKEPRKSSADQEKGARGQDRETSEGRPRLAGFAQGSGREERISELRCRSQLLNR